MTRHIISVILENESGALSRVIGLFSQRGYNIESLTVAPTEEPSLSRMTIQIISDLKTLEQIKKQLNKLIDVLRVNELTKNLCIEREILLIKFQVSNNKTGESESIINKFYGQIVDIQLKCYIVQISGDSKKLDDFINNISRLAKIKEVVRSGVITISNIAH